LHSVRSRVTCNAVWGCPALFMNASAAIADPLLLRVKRRSYLVVRKH